MTNHGQSIFSCCQTEKGDHTLRIVHSINYFIHPSFRFAAISVKSVELSLQAWIINLVSPENSLQLPLELFSGFLSLELGCFFLLVIHLPQ